MGWLMDGEISDAAIWQARRLFEFRENTNSEMMQSCLKDISSLLLPSVYD